MFISSLKTFFKNIKLIVPSIISSAIFFIFSLPFITFDVNFDILSAEEVLSYSYKLIAILLFFCIFYTISNIIVQCWTIHMSVLVVNGNEYKLIDSLKKSLKYFWRVLGLYAIKFAIYFSIGMILLFTLIPFLISAEQNISFSSALPITILIITAILIIFLSVTLLPIIYVIISDNLGLGKGFSIGFKLGIKKFFRLFGVTLLIIIIIVLINLPFASFDYTVTSGIIDILNMIIGSFFTVTIGIYIINLYNSQKLKNESSNILEENQDTQEISEIESKDFDDSNSKE